MAVGDIEAIQKEAELQKLALQVKFKIEYLISIAFWATAKNEKLALQIKSKIEYLISIIIILRLPSGPLLKMRNCHNCNILGAHLEVFEFTVLRKMYFDYMCESLYEILWPLLKKFHIAK